MAIIFIPSLRESSPLRASIYSFMYTCIFGAAFIFLTIGVIAYSIMFHEIAPEKDQQLNSEEEFPTSFGAVMKVLSEDERKICMAIWKEGGTALQKDVKWRTGFSKVKIYRVTERLASRGVITVTKEDRRNRLSLASWLYKSTKDMNPSTYHS